jgi:hypothetical protein
VTLAVDTGVVQARVTGVCPAGQVMTGIKATGAVDCAADAQGSGDITGVTAGVGLSGGAESGNATLSVTPADFQRRAFASNYGAAIVIDNDGGTSDVTKELLEIEITVPAAGYVVVHGGGISEVKDTELSVAKAVEWQAWICNADPATNTLCSPPAVGRNISAVIGNFSYSSTGVSWAYYDDYTTFAEFYVATAGTHRFWLVGWAKAGNEVYYSRSRLHAEYIRP